MEKAQVMGRWRSRGRCGITFLRPWNHTKGEGEKEGGRSWRGALHFAREHLKVQVFLGMFSGADQTHEGVERCPPPGTPPDSGTDHCPDPGGCCFGDGVCLQPAPPLAAPGHGPCPAWGGTALAEQLLGAGDVEVGSGRATGMAQGL